MSSHLSFASQLQVLVIDDHAIMRKIIRRLLKDSGIETVAEAENGRKGLDYLLDPECVEPDVILCDLYMDEMSGTEFLHKLRRSKHTDITKIPVIVLTGEKDEMVLDVAYQVGADGILHKPVTPQDLRKEIERVVGCRLEATSTTPTQVRESEWISSQRSA
ncbi:MAG: response regulator [Rhodospirillaceae bacterium]|nr:response regulator [Rhodospirillaceae bacterium]MBT5665885.1 response regulator [Rhodospirillaceae bacterium]MBT5809194.1 response regulator [Rhodospirillaceae bacterium]